MPWPIPQPGDIANRASATLEVEFQRVYGLKFPGSAPVVVDARSPFSVLAIYARVIDGATFDLWAYLPRTAQELMVDTSSDWLSRHATLWGIARIQAIGATGNVAFTGAAGTQINVGVQLTGIGLPGVYTVQDSVTAATVGGVRAYTIAVGATTVSVPVLCSVAGAAGSAAAGTSLTLVTPIGGLTSQSAVVGSLGLIGADIEAIAAWRSRILARIRQRGTGGNENDYIQWTQEVLPTSLVSATSPATGLINVAFAMPNGLTWRVPTSGEIASVTVYLNDGTKRKPLGAPVITVVSAALVPVNFSLHLNPDTPANRLAAQTALGAQLLADAVIPDATHAGTIFMSRIDAALANASGEFSHERAAPAADVTVSFPSLAVLGTVTFT